MTFKLMLLERVVKWLVGGELFQFITDAVTTMNDTSMTGEEKRAQVLKEVREFFSGTLTVLVNLAIEVAVLLLKDKIGAIDGN